MTRFYTNRSDFEQNHWLDSQKSRVVAMLQDIDSVSSTVQSEGLSHLYHSRGEASLGASKPSSTFSQAVDRVDSMLRSAGKIHKDIVQNIDSKFTKGLDKSFQSLNEVNGSKNPYMSKGKYEKTYTTTNYTSNYGYVTQTHTRQVHYSLSDILDGTKSPIPAAQSLYQDRVKSLREQLRQTDQLTDKQIKELESIGKLAKYADEGVEALQWGSGVLQGDAANATLDYIGGKAFEGIVEGSVKGLQSQLSHIEVSSPSQIQLNARQGQDFVDLQTVEFGKVASKVENNITIKMTVDGVEQKIRVDAIGFDEAGNIRIQEYTTAQNGLKISRQNLLEDLSKYGGTIVGAGKGDFVGGVEIPKGTRIDVVSQKTGNVTIGGDSFSPEWEKLRQSFPEPQIDADTYSQITSIKVTETTKRPPVTTYLETDYIKNHNILFDEEVAAFAKDDYWIQKEGFFGRPDGAFVFPKDVAEAMVKESGGDPRVLEKLLGLDVGSLGEHPIMIEPQKIDNLRIPSGNEDGSRLNPQWRPGGKTYPGGVPEAVIDRVPKDGLIIKELWGN
ncbi:hypothetical protein [Streptococcus suis]|uniref:hypothetical protein n=1 Tax=Streptococcus suis TaxID=1307 RepID=UPI0004009F1C|nr:hypothetical protein [Streptococcus suis]HEM4252956.1 hypothetical protein [Streptococcus suis]